MSLAHHLASFVSSALTLTRVTCQARHPPPRNPSAFCLCLCLCLCLCVAPNLVPATVIIATSTTFNIFRQISAPAATPTPASQTACFVFYSLRATTTRSCKVSPARCVSNSSLVSSHILGPARSSHITHHTHSRQLVLGANCGRVPAETLAGSATHQPALLPTSPLTSRQRCSFHIWWWVLSVVNSNTNYTQCHGIIPTTPLGVRQTCDARPRAHGRRHIHQWALRRSSHSLTLQPVLLPSRE